MRGSRGILVLAPMLAVACALPGAAAVQVTPGQEFVYNGTAEWKEKVTGRPPETFSGPVKVTALVTQVDATQGYSVVVMRTVQPKAPNGQPPSPGYADVTTVRYHPNLSSASAQAGAWPEDQLGRLLQLLDLPLAPRADLKAGDWWLAEAESRPVLLPRTFRVFYQVAGVTKIGDRMCLKVVKTRGDRLPIQIQQALPNLPPARSPSSPVELADYRETLCIDRATAQVVSLELRARQVIGKNAVTRDLNA